MSSINDRIKSIMDHYSLSIKEVAEKCGVQRAAVSHVLNGRNRPSVPFLVALSESFPDLNPAWLLHGKGEMVTNVSAPPKPYSKQEDTGDTGISRQEKPPLPSIDKKIERVIVFYTDGSFSSYYPDQS